MQYRRECDCGKWGRGVLVRTALLAGGLGTWGPATPPGFAGAPGEANAESHAVFVGLALTYVDEGQIGRVVDVRKNSVEVVANHVTAVVARNAVGELRAKRQPAVSGVQVSISNVNGDLAYSAKNDPTRAALLEQSRLDAYQTERQVATQGELLMTQLQRPSEPGVPGGKSADAIRTEVDAATKKYTDVVASRSRDELYDAGARIHNSSARAHGAAYDSFAVTFQISSEEVIEDAYAVMLLVVRSPQAPSVPLTALELAPLPRITAKARTVVIMRGGLPDGFAVERYEIHVYRRGSELASNLSEKTVRVTRADAHKFLVLEHATTNPTGDVAPEIASELLPAAHPAPPDQDLDRRVHVTLDAGGNVTSATPVEPEAGPLSAEIVSFIQATAFLPGLKEGEPVSSSITLPLVAFLR